MKTRSVWVRPSLHFQRALHVARPVFPPLAMRELAANALIHQDMMITGAGPMIEIFDDRIEITNPGKPLIDTKRFLDAPPRSRNEALASFLRRIGVCEERGSGVDKVIAQAEAFQLPAPDFQVVQESTRAILYAPGSFGRMTPAERIRACYQHAALRWVSGARATNASLRERFGVSDENAAQMSRVFADTRDEGLIKLADEASPRGGCVPIWA